LLFREDTFAFELLSFDEEVDDEGDSDDNQVEWCVKRFSLDTSANLGKVIFEFLRELGFEDSTSKLTRGAGC
jgi:hypothetical protein